MADKSQIIDWVERSIANEDIENYEIKITGNSEKDEGYMGDIIFVTVEGIRKDNQKTTLHLVVKHAKINEHLREAMPVKMIFENEILMYCQLIPAFQRFQQKKQIDDIFNCIAKCYYSSSSTNTEVLVLENLKAAAFENYDRKKPMDSSHCKAVLYQMGRFHAISFAMRDQKEEELTALTSKMRDPMKWFMDLPEAIASTKKSQEFLLDLLRKNGDLDLYEKLEKLFAKSFEMMTDIFNNEEPQYVVIHGDPWCNNFMFKYEETDKTNPSKVAILDWQMSTTRSPVFDLTYFFYVVCSKTELDSFEELLKYYYDSFAEHLSELGSNPEELFSYSDLKRHWRRYSIYGLVTACVSLKIFLCDKKNAPDLGSIEEGKSFMDMFIDVPLGETSFYDRIKPVVSHYFDFIEKE